MIESNWINYKQVELIDEIMTEDNVSESLKKYKLYEALSKIQNALTNQGKSVTIEGTAFDYKVFQFLIQAKTELAPNADDEQVIDIGSFMGGVIIDESPYVIKDMDTSYVTIDNKLYKDNNTRIVYTGSASPTTDAKFYTSQLCVSLIQIRLFLHIPYYALGT